jgi:hypothetical protein
VVRGQAAGVTIPPDTPMPGVCQEFVMTEYPLRTAAYHEAGHAIVGWRLGLRVYGVRIGIGGDLGKGGADIEQNEGLSLIDKIAVCYGGIAAQDMLGLEAHPQSGMMDEFMVSCLLGEDREDTEEGLALRDDGYKKARALLEPHCEV